MVGKKDWRLPTAAELETLLDRSLLHDKLRPTMRQEVPFRDILSYWSSTTFAPDTYSACIVMFDGAYVLSYYKSNSYHVPPSAMLAPCNAEPIALGSCFPITFCLNPCISFSWPSASNEVPSSAAVLKRSAPQVKHASYQL